MISAGLISGAMGAVGGIFNSIFGASSARRNRKRAMNVLNDEEKRLDNLFNQEYYQNYLNRSDAQGMLSTLRNRNTQQNTVMRNNAVVMGATPEVLAAQQKTLADSYGQSINDMAANADNWKSNVLGNYNNGKSHIADMRYNNYMSAAGQGFGQQMYGMRQYENNLQNAVGFFKEIF